MKTLVVIEIEHKKPLQNLAEMVAQRAYTLDGVEDAKVHVGAGEAVIHALQAKNMFRHAKAEMIAILDKVEESLA